MAEFEHHRIEHNFNQNEKYIEVNTELEKVNSGYREITHNKAEVRVRDHSFIWVGENIGEDALIQDSALVDKDLKEIPDIRTSIHLQIPSGKVKIENYSSLYTGNEAGGMKVFMYGDEATLFTHTPDNLEILDANNNSIQAPDRIFVLPDVTLDPKKIFDSDDDTDLKVFGDNSLVYKGDREEIFALKVKAKDGVHEGIVFFVRKHRLSQEDNDKLVFIGGGKADQFEDILRSMRIKLGKDDEQGLHELEEKVVVRFNLKYKDQHWKDEEKQNKFATEIHKKPEMTIDEAIDKMLEKKVKDESLESATEDFNNVNEAYLEKFYSQKNRETDEYGSVVLSPSNKSNPKVKELGDEPAMQNIFIRLRKGIEVSTN